MRILVISYEFPPLGGGGSPVCEELAKGYSDSGNLVTVVTMGFTGLTFHEKKDNLNIYRLNCLRRKKELCTPHEMLLFIMKSILFLRSHLKTNYYDVCHTHFIIPSGIIAMWLKKKYNLPYIITAHGSDVPGYNQDRFTFLHKFTPRLLQKICNNSELIVTPSNYLGKLIEKNIGVQESKLIKIPNGLKVDKFTPQKKKNIILSTGRLLPRKGFHHLIKAVSDIDTDYQLHIAGDGPMASELKNLAKNSKTKVIFHGWLDNSSKQYHNLLATAAIYCLASSKENASISLLEAMSAGCAIITTDVSGCPETVEDCGLIVKPDNVEDLKNKISLLINNKELINTCGKKARTLFLSNYTSENIINKYFSCLIQCTQKNQKQKKT